MKVNNIQIDGKKVKYITKGKGRDIIFIHGLGGSYKIWGKVVKKVSKKFKCWAVSLPEYREFDIKKLSDLITEFIQKMEIKKPLIVGHSLGGLISIDFSNRNDFEKMILVSTPLTRITPKGLRSLVNSMDEKIEESKFFRDLSEWILRRIPLTKRELNTMSLESFINYVKGILEMNFPFNISKLNLDERAILVYGKRDSLLKIIHGSDLYDEIGSKRIIVLDADHGIPEKNSKELSEIIIDFFSEKPKTFLDDFIESSVESIKDIVGFIKTSTSD